MMSPRYCGFLVNRYGPVVMNCSLIPEVFFNPSVIIPQKNNIVPKIISGIAKWKRNCVEIIYVSQSININKIFNGKIIKNKIQVNKYCQDHFFGGGQILFLGKNIDQMIPNKYVYRHAKSINKSSNLYFKSSCSII